MTAVEYQPQKWRDNELMWRPWFPLSPLVAGGLEEYKIANFYGLPENRLPDYIPENHIDDVHHCLTVCTFDSRRKRNEARETLWHRGMVCALSEWVQATAAVLAKPEEEKALTQTACLIECRFAVLLDKLLNFVNCKQSTPLHMLAREMGMSRAKIIHDLVKKGLIDDDIDPEAGSLAEELALILFVGTDRDYKVRNFGCESKTLKEKFNDIVVDLRQKIAQEVLISDSWQAEELKGFEKGFCVWELRGLNFEEEELDIPAGWSLAEHKVFVRFGQKDLNELLPEVSLEMGIYIKNKKSEKVRFLAITSNTVTPWLERGPISDACETRGGEKVDAWQRAFAMPTIPDRENEGHPFCWGGIDEALWEKWGEGVNENILYLYVSEQDCRAMLIPNRPSIRLLEEQLSLFDQGLLVSVLVRARRNSALLRELEGKLFLDLYPKRWGCLDEEFLLVAQKAGEVIGIRENGLISDFNLKHLMGDLLVTAMLDSKFFQEAAVGGPLHAMARKQLPNFPIYEAGQLASIYKEGEAYSWVEVIKEMQDKQLLNPALAGLKDKWSRFCGIFNFGRTEELSQRLTQEFSLELEKLYRSEQQLMQAKPKGTSVIIESESGKYQVNEDKIFERWNSFVRRINQGLINGNFTDEERGWLEAEINELRVWLHAYEEISGFDIGNLDRAKRIIEQKRVKAPI